MITESAAPDLDKYYLIQNDPLYDAVEPKLTISPISGALSAIDSVGHLHDAVKSKDPTEKTIATTRAVVSLSQGAESLLIFAEGVDAVRGRSTAYIPRVSAALLPFQALGLALGVHDMATEGLDHMQDMMKKKKPTEKAIAASRAVVTASTTVENAVYFSDSMASLEAISLRAAAWTSVASIVLLPFQFLGLGLNVYDTARSGRLLHALNKFETISDRTIALLSSLQALKEFHANKITALMDKIRYDNDGKAFEAGEKLVEKLKNRVKKEVGIHSASTALTIAAIVLSILMIVGTGGIALLVAGAAVGVVGIGLFAYSLYNKYSKK